MPSSASSFSRPSDIPVDVWNAASWLTEIWKDGRLNKRQAYTYSVMLSLHRSGAMRELHRIIVEFIAETRSGRPPRAILSPLGSCPALGYVRAGRPRRPMRPTLEGKEALAPGEWLFTTDNFMIPELTRETLRQAAPLTASAADVHAALSRAYDAGIQALRRMKKPGQADVHVAAAWDTVDYHFDPIGWVELLKRIAELRVVFGARHEALADLMKRARISPRSAAVKRTNRIKFLSEAGTELTRELAKDVEGRGRRRHGGVRTLRAHKVALNTAAGILNAAYGPLLDRPLTADDLKSRFQHRSE